MPDDLVSRLSETLDDLERVASAASPGRWEFEDSSEDTDGAIFARDGEDWGVEVAYARGKTVAVQDANGAHIARWDPQAVLRLVAAHREILRLLETEERVHAQGPSPGSSHSAAGRRSALLDVVRTLAKVWGITEEETA